MATLQDIAKLTGISLSVVSRALNPNPDQQVSLAAKEKIEAAVKELNYKRNNTASFMARGKNATIGVFLPSYAYSLIADLSIGLSNEAIRRGFPCNFYYGLQEKDYKDFLMSAKSNGNSGIISYPPLFKYGIFSEMLNEYKKTGGKILLLNTPPIPEYEIKAVSLNNRLGGTLVGKYLYEKECDTFFCLLSKNSWQSSERHTAFTDFMKSKNIAVQPIYVKACSFQQFCDFNLSEIVRSCKQKQIGIFATSDFIALNVIRELTLNGFREILGNQIKIIGYDDLPTSQYSIPSLTTVHQSFRQLGAYSMGSLINMISGIKEPLPDLPSPELVIRESA